MNPLLSNSYNFVLISLNLDESILYGEMDIQWLSIFKLMNRLCPNLEEKVKLVANTFEDSYTTGTELNRCDLNTSFSKIL